MKLLRILAGVICLGVTPRASLGQNIPAPNRIAYEDAVHHKNAVSRIKGLQSFLEDFPTSTLKEGALESLLKAYSETGDWSLEQQTLDRLLQTNPDNLYGVTLKAKTLLGCHGPNCEQELVSITNRGLFLLSSARKPDYVTDAEFTEQEAEASTIFHRLAGLMALTHHDYQAAQEHLALVVASKPAEFGSVYPLALAYLKTDPPDVRGFFFLARAAALAPVGTQKEIVAYGEGEYQKYHGSKEGWTKLLRLAKTNVTVPSGFTVAPAQKTP